jgi:hypothetical protein
MSVQLLPPDYEKRVQEAVRAFWLARRSSPSTRSQGGTRDAVIAGKNMDGFCELVRHVAVHCGLSPDAVQTRRGSVVLPGYFRATKTWDVLVIHQRRLIAAFEFKSQVGSLGNNFNNRSEEAIGSAADLWIAHRQGAFSTMLPRLSEGDQRATTADPRPPFLGWLMLLEDSEAARVPVGVDEPNYPAFPEFRGASYARRYQLLCERLMKEQLYGCAALLLSDPEVGAGSGAHRELSAPTSHRTLFAEFAARTAAAVVEAPAGAP